ncbi:MULTISPECIES: hypothetical protein [unclassified Variovorax]|uniref:hypothetical protein n=1 Tax=unclassified Variovorax TaxID=663243 RepID=UPI001BD1FB25|nr:MULTISPECIES: hypothetical protein [unclassified Variovorax]
MDTRVPAPGASPRLRASAMLLALLAAALDAQAYTIAITAGSRTLYLQVGVGSSLGAVLAGGGLPPNNSTVNQVSVTVPAAGSGSGTPYAMATDSPVSNSPYDDFAGYCTPTVNGEVYVGGFFRVPGAGAGAAATLTVTAPPNLVSASGATLPFSEIEWTSAGLEDVTPTIPSGRFPGTGATSTLLSVARNTWFESCLAFRYLNTRLVPGGTYSGRAVYTLTAP